MFKGIPCAPGLGIGKVFILKEPKIAIDDITLSGEKAGQELELLDRAFDTSIVQLNELFRTTSENVGEEESKIIDAQIMMLSDPDIMDEIKQKIQDEKRYASAVVQEVFAEKVALFEAIEDEYLRERAADLKDAGKRLLMNILGLPIRNIGTICEEVILVAENITPSQIVSVNKLYVKGIVTETGGPTSHVAIIARNMDMPAVMGIKGIVSQLEDGRIAAVDGSKGIVQLPSDKAEEDKFRERITLNMCIKQELKLLRELPAKTLDGKRFELAANIGLANEAELAVANGAEAIGLLRTEFLYMEKNNLPDEEEQFSLYKSVAEEMKGRPVIIRTLDIGGDKEVKSFEIPKEENPFLGWRAIRICLDEKELFKCQLRAILRASSFGKVRLMYPMISSVTEVRRANAVLEEVKQALRDEGISFDNNIEVGIMIEIPSAAIAADLLIKEVDFFSIGTNDLTQYTLAVDRGNQKVSSYYNYCNPSVLRLIRNVIDVSHKAGKFTGMCGEMAGNPLTAVLLAGFGLDEFSMSPSSILKVKKVIRSIGYEYAKEVADTAMGFATSEDVEKYLKKVMEDIDLSYILEV